MADVLSLNRPIRLGSSSEPVAPDQKRCRRGVTRGYTGTQIFSTTGALSDPGEPLHCGIAGGASHWFALDRGGGRRIAGEHRWQFVRYDPGDLPAHRSPAYENLQPIGCDNNSGLDGRDSKVTVTVQRLRTYFIVVDGVNGASGQVAHAL
jgi:hypothetical protein